MTITDSDGTAMTADQLVNHVEDDHAVLMHSSEDVAPLRILGAYRPTASPTTDNGESDREEAIRRSRARHPSRGARLHLVEPA